MLILKIKFYIIILAAVLMVNSDFYKVNITEISVVNDQVLVDFLIKNGNVVLNELRSTQYLLIHEKDVGEGFRIKIFYFENSDVAQDFVIKLNYILKKIINETYVHDNNHDIDEILFILKKITKERALNLTEKNNIKIISEFISQTKQRESSKSLYLYNMYINNASNINLIINNNVYPSVQIIFIMNLILAIFAVSIFFKKES
jgi:hypothetical protein